MAHRGASGYLPEHTLLAVAMAHAFNVDYIEPDVVMTKDDELVVLHDHHIDTTTDVEKKFPKRKREDGRFYAVDFTLKEIKTLTVRERFNPKTGEQIFPNRFSSSLSFKVPTFREFIELVQSLNKSRKKNIGIIPEIKQVEFHLKMKKDITHALIKVLREYGYEKDQKAIIQSFWPNSLKRLKNEFKTTIPLLQLVAKNSWNETSFDYKSMFSLKGLKEVKKYASIISYPLDNLIDSSSGLKLTNTVKKVRESKLKLYAFTYRRESLSLGMSEEKFFKFLKNDLELDGLFTDFPDIKVPQ